MKDSEKIEKMTAILRYLHRTTSGMTKMRIRKVLKEIDAPEPKEPKAPRKRSVADIAQDE